MVNDANSATVMSMGGEGRTFTDRYHMVQTINNDLTLTGGEKPLLAGRYQAIRPLGSGGMGSVWLVEDTQLDNKLFAVKMLPPIMFSNKRAFLHLKKEALVAMNLVHPNIVQIRAFEENNGAPFLVMDYIEGQTLDDYIADNDDGILSEEETVRLLKPIAAALDYAHGEGVVHRDIKPANVMIRKDGRPFILDFGIACEVQETMSRMTGSKLSSGTLPYMSPEQINGELPKPAHDVYSFAAMVYECLKGEPPFVRGEIIHQILNNPPPPLPQGIVSWLSEITMRGLAKTADERPATCCEILGGSSSGGDNADNDIKLQTQEAINAYHDEEYAKAFSSAQKADKDNPAIQYILGWCCLYGKGIETDSDTALKWFRKAAEQGNADAQYEFGKSFAIIFDKRLRKKEELEGVAWLRKAAEQGQKEAQYYLGHYLMWYYDTRDTSKDIQTEGVDWLHRAAEKGHVKAQSLLAYSYWAGDGVERNYVKAVKWYRAAAEEGDAESQYGLGRCYEQGLGVDMNLKEAIHWYFRAADQGYTDAQYKLGWCFYNGKGWPKNYADAVTWYRKAAEQGHMYAQFYLGWCYYKGDGVPHDKSEAVKWYRKAAEQGNVDAIYNLGCCYDSGDGVERDCVEAAKWYQKAAERGHALAQGNLGTMYANGEGVNQDYNEALVWCRKAAEQGNVVAQYNCGWMYENGLGVAKNDYEAIKWYARAAEQGHADALTSLSMMAEQGYSDAQDSLALMYLNGKGVEKNYTEAFEWFRNAAAQGSATAQYNLGVMGANGLGADGGLQSAVEWYRKAAEQGHEKAKEALKETEGILKNDEVFKDVMREFLKTTGRETSKPFSRPAVIRGRPKPLSRQEQEPELEEEESPVPPDSDFSTGRRGEYRLGDVNYVDVSKQGLFGGMVSSFIAGMSGKGVVTSWDRLSGTWDEMKRSEGGNRRRRRRN